MRIALISALILLLTSQGSAFAKVLSEYDRYKNTTLFATPMVKTQCLSCSFFGPLQSLRCVAAFQREGGGNLSKPALTFHSLVGVSKGWMFLGVKSIDLIIDGTPMTLPAEQNGEILRQMNMLEETVFIPIEPSLLEVIANAQLVEGRLNGIEFRFKPEQLAEYRELWQAYQLNRSIAIKPDLGTPQPIANTPDNILVHGRQAVSDYYKSLIGLGYVFESELQGENREILFIRCSPDFQDGTYKAMLANPLNFKQMGFKQIILKSESSEAVIEP